MGFAFIFLNCKVMEKDYYGAQIKVEVKSGTYRGYMKLKIRIHSYHPTENTKLVSFPVVLS